jgi:transposase-like protein
MSCADQTGRMKKLAELCWVLGLSCRRAEQILYVFGVKLSFMSVWRDVQEGAQKIVRRNQWQAVRVLGLDGAYVLGWGEKRPVLVAVDMGSGEPVALGYVDEYSLQAVQRFLEPLVQRLGVSVIVTDDLMSYRKVAERLELGHQVCQFRLAEASEQLKRQRDCSTLASNT